jgi:predicted transposase YdaD
VLRINIETGDNLNEEERDLAMNLTPMYKEWQQKTLQERNKEGNQEGELTLVLRQLKRRFGAINDEMRSQINQLPVAQLEDLGEALLDFLVPPILRTGF